MQLTPASWCPPAFSCCSVPFPRPSTPFSCVCFLHPPPPLFLPQVLVSLQSMVFVADPYYNEPGEGHSGAGCSRRIQAAVCCLSHMCWARPPCSVLV
jgi:hypothetical protein